MRKAITYTKWNLMGAAGNMMFELSVLYSMAERYKRKPVLPREWKYQKYFKHKVRIEVPDVQPVEIGEPSFHFSGWEYWDKKEQEAGDTFGIGGWFQSSKYFSKEIAKKLFEFTDEFRAEMMAKWGHIFTKPVIIIGFRVGQDYISNGNYEILSPLYQISALWKYFPDWRENYNILVCSDDMQYARLNMDCADNIYFADGINMEQLFLGTLGTHHILANSSFSWWQSFLKQTEGGITIRPSKYYKGYLETVSDTKDFWEEEWIEHDYRGEKLNLKDVSFTIPVRYDSPDRMENMQMVEEWLWKNFDTNVYVMEYDTQAFSNGTYAYTWIPREEMPYFWRTKMLNKMAEMNNTPYIVNLDCDNIVPVMQIMIGVDMLRKGEAELAYPYDGRAARVEDRQKWRPKLMASGIDCGVFKNVIFRGTRPIDAKSVGHIVMWNRDVFFKIGGENESFISYGPEDVERWERAEKLGIAIKRVKGICYHMDHWMGEDSSGANQFFGQNYAELARLRKLSRDELWNEISLWKLKTPSE